MSIGLRPEVLRYAVYQLVPVSSHCDFDSGGKSEGMHSRI